MSSSTNRNDFSLETKEILKQRAAYICSNPSCKRMTIAPSSEDETKVQYIGICAHITAAASGGSRYNLEISDEERSGIANGIFLCSNCATLIDKNNGIDYSVQTIKSWKHNHEEFVLQNLNKTLDSQQNTTIVSSQNQQGGITASIVNVLTTEKSDPVKNHDLILFQNAENIFNEKDFERTYTYLDGGTICEKDMDKIEDIREFYLKSSNQYISNNVEQAKKHFCLSTDNINKFIGTEFDRLPHDRKIENYKLHLSPQNNIDHADESLGHKVNRRRYQELEDQLVALLQIWKETYHTFRTEIKKTLHV